MLKKASGCKMQRALTELEPPPCEALIFDCDGTLADTFPIHFSVIRTVLARSGIDFDEAWYRAHVGLSANDLLDQIGAKWGVRLALETFEQDRAPLYKNALAEVREMEPVVAVARRYAGVVPLAVASGGSRALVERTLGNLGISGLFKAVVTVDDVACGKPAPDLYELAARRLAVSPSACVVYEDTDEGLAAAHAAHMVAIDVRPFVGTPMRCD